MNRESLECAVEIDHVQILRAFLGPAFRHRDRIFGIRRDLVGFPLPETNTSTAFQVDGGYDKDFAHDLNRNRNPLPNNRLRLEQDYDYDPYPDIHSPKFFNICRPTFWLFSGWNWTATTLSFQIADA